MRKTWILIVALLVVPATGCQNQDNQDRTGTVVLQDSDYQLIWRNVLSPSLLYDSVLEDSVFAVLNQEYDADWNGGEIQQSTDPCNTLVLQRGRGSDAGQFPPYEPGLQDHYDFSWRLHTHLLNCGTADTTLTNGDAELYLQAATNGIQLTQTLKDYSVKDFQANGLYNGYVTLQSYWKMTSDGLPAASIVDWQMQNQSLVAAPEAGIESAVAVTSQLHLRGTILSPEVIGLQVVSGFWQQGEIRALIESTPLLYDVGRCPLLLQDVEGNTVEFPGYPTMLYSGTVTITVLPALQVYELIYSDCSLLVVEDGEVSGRWTADNFEDQAFLITKLLGSVPGRLALRASLLNLESLRLLTRDWCETDTKTCHQFRYDPFVDGSKAYWLQLGEMISYDDATANPISSATFQSSLRTLSWGVTATVTDNTWQYVAAEDLSQVPLFALGMSAPEPFEDSMFMVPITGPVTRTTMWEAVPAVDGEELLLAAPGFRPVRQPAAGDRRLRPHGVHLPAHLSGPALPSVHSGVRFSTSDLR